MSGGPGTARRAVCIVTAVPISLRAFFPAHVAVLRERYDITLVSTGTAADVAPLLGPHVRFLPVSIARRIAPFRDLRALIALYRLFRIHRFDLVHSMTPKAGLLAMVAARAAGVPNRVHTFTGQVWSTRTGAGRWLLKSLDRLLANSATALLADSASQARFLVDNRIAGAGEVEVLADGSVAGVDMERFRPDTVARARVRTEYRISDAAVLFLFLGRWSRDKGVGDLAQAFALASQTVPDIHLLVVGPDEDGFAAEISGLARRCPGRVHAIGYAERPEDYMAAADVFCLPSYREGFPVVIIEAAAVGLPAIASRIYGITDAVDDGVTGVLHPPGSIREIAAAMVRLASDERERRAMGVAARARAGARFSQARVTEALATFYRMRLEHPVFP